MHINRGVSLLSHRKTVVFYSSWRFIRLQIIKCCTYCRHRHDWLAAKFGSVVPNCLAIQPLPEMCNIFFFSIFDNWMSRHLEHILHIAILGNLVLLLMSQLAIEELNIFLAFKKKKLNSRQRQNLNIFP